MDHTEGQKTHAANCARYSMCSPLPQTIFNRFVTKVRAPNQLHSLKTDHHKLSGFKDCTQAQWLSQVSASQASEA